MWEKRPAWHAVSRSLPLLEPDLTLTWSSQRHGITVLLRGHRHQGFQPIQHGRFRPLIPRNTLDTVAFGRSFDSYRRSGETVLTRQCASLFSGVQRTFSHKAKPLRRQPVNALCQISDLVGHHGSPPCFSFDGDDKCFRRKNHQARRRRIHRLVRIAHSFSAPPIILTNVKGGYPNSQNDCQ